MNKDVAQVYKADDGWRWRIKAANGEVVAQGEAYTRKADARERLTDLFPDTPIVELDEE